MTLGQVILDARKTMGLTQRELASRIKKDDGISITPVYLHDIERGRNNPRSEYLLSQLANALDLPEEYLYFLAGIIPSNLRAGSHAPQRVVAAFDAFKSALMNGTRL